MSTTTEVYTLDAGQIPGLCHAPDLSQDSANAVNALLEKNRLANHVFTTSERKMGASLHNHIVHHTMTLFALGASAQKIRAHAERNTSYQLPPIKMPAGSIVESMEDESVYKKYLGNEDHYADFVAFFDSAISRWGFEAVLQKYLLGDGELARDMLPRIYMGYVHGFMYCGLALEFKQPAILAEGLAQSAVHHDMWYTDFLLAAEAAAQLRTESALPLCECMDACLADPIVTSCSSVDYHFQIKGESWFIKKEMVRDGVVANAGEEMLRICARYRVEEANIEFATAELINTACYISAAAQRRPHEARYDFFLIHGSNASIWTTAFLNEPSLTNKQKARLLEYTGRVILLLFASMGCPRPDIDWIASHPARLPDGNWPSLFERAIAHEDDGHMCKLVRALCHAQQVSKPYDHLPQFRLKQSHFLPAANAALDSGSAQPMQGVWHFDFVRGAAFPEAWSLVPLRGQQQQPRDGTAKAWIK